MQGGWLGSDRAVSLPRFSAAREMWWQARIRSRMTDCTAAGLPAVSAAQPSTCGRDCCWDVWENAAQMRGMVVRLTVVGHSKTKGSSATASSTPCADESPDDASPEDDALALPLPLFLCFLLVSSSPASSSSSSEYCRHLFTGVDFESSESSESSEPSESSESSA